MMFVGVDGCKKGWFAIKLTEGEEYEPRVFENIDQLWIEFKSAAVILIDIPIGLKEQMGTGDQVLQYHISKKSG
jgi:predicted RNase H-like nuclease